MTKIHSVSIIYDHHNDSLSPLLSPAVISATIASCLQYISQPRFLRGRHLGQMSVSTPVSGHPALNVFLWKIKGCMNCPVEHRDTRWAHQIIQHHYFMAGDLLNHRILILKKVTCPSQRFSIRLNWCVYFFWGFFVSYLQCEIYIKNWCWIILM